MPADYAGAGVIRAVILQLGLRKTVRIDLLQNSLVVVLNQPDFPGDREGPHAKCGVWWVDESSLRRSLVCVEPVLISEDEARAHGLESEILYPIRPPGGAGPSQSRRHKYLCYGWDGDIYLPHSVVHVFTMIEHGQDCYSPFWELSFDGMSWVLSGFDPSVDPVAGLAVHEVMDAQ